MSARPQWVRDGASLDVDFENGRFYWNRATKSLSDLTSVSGNAYYLSGYDAGITSGEATVVLEYAPTLTTGQWTNTLFSWTSGYPGGNRFEWVEADNATGDTIRLYYNPGVPSANYQQIPTYSKLSEGGTRYLGADRHRAITVLKSSTTITAMTDNSVLHTDLTGVPGTIAAPTRIGFLCRAWASGTPDSVATDITLYRVTIYPAALDITSINAIATAGRAPPVHLLGDSFLNSYDIMMEFERLIGPSGYIGRSQDAVGGSTLTEQAARFASADAKWRNATLVICDFGRETNATDTIAALTSIRATLGHNRWIYMQSSPSSPPDSTYDTAEAAIKAWCGTHYIDTLDPALAQSDGSAEDLARVAQRMWPTSLVISDVDFHPNSVKGNPFVAGLIHTALTSRGWA